MAKDTERRVNWWFFGALAFSIGLWWFIIWWFIIATVRFIFWGRL